MSKKKPLKHNVVIPKAQEAKLQGSICANIHCKLRKAGCRGFEGCPGYLAKS